MPDEQPEKIERKPQPPYVPRPLPDGVEDALRRFNPWWHGLPMEGVPQFRRHFVAHLRARMDARAAPIVVLRGPRQIGKSTAHLQLISDLLAEGVAPQRIMRVQFDDIPEFPKDVSPVLAIAGWFERTILGRTFNGAAHAGEHVYLFFDEVQNLFKWAGQLKSLVDHAAVRMYMTGSSALRIAAGGESLAGRVTTMEAGALSLTEIATVRNFGKLEPFLGDNGRLRLREEEFWRALVAHGRANAAVRDVAFAAFSQRGGYPFVHLNPAEAWEFSADRLMDTVIRRVIQHDLQTVVGEKPSNSALLEEVARLLFRYAGQAPGIETLQREVRAQLGPSADLQAVPVYLQALADTLLVYLIRPTEMRLKKQDSGQKICLVDHALRAAWLQEVIPLDPTLLADNPALTSLAGHIAESVVGATFAKIMNLDFSWFPARNAKEPEVDFVLQLGFRRVPVEVKYRAQIDGQRDIRGMQAFLDRKVNESPFGLLITQFDTDVVTDPRIITMPLSTLMLLR